MALKVNTSIGYGRAGFAAEKKEETPLLCETRVDYPCPTPLLDGLVRQRLPTKLSLLLPILFDVVLSWRAASLRIATQLFRSRLAYTLRHGIKWTYVKDLANYLTLFKTNQTLIFDLGNLINEIYTAPFNVTSQRQEGCGNQSSRSLDEAVEEFWWGNVLQSEIDTFHNAGTLLGYSPFREVQQYIDGLLAGAVWPFPIIFTGSVVPGLWRPIVGIDAFNLNEAELNITPWLPLLCDGRSPTFEICVSGLNDVKDTASHSGNTDTEWYISGKIFI